MVHFPAWADMTYGFSHAYPGIGRDGFPHSEIDGSKPVCGSPSLIAAYHVLHRLLAPRHPPYALSSLTIRTRTVGLRRGGQGPAARASSLTPGTRSLIPDAARVGSETHCVWVVGKLPLQSIQLSKSTGNVTAVSRTCVADSTASGSRREPSCRPSTRARMRARSGRVEWWRIPGSNR